MVTYEQFGDSVDAHLNYAMDLSAAEALPIFSRRLGDGSWRRAFSTWVQRLNTWAFRAARDEPATFRSIMAQLVSVLVDGGIDDAAHEALSTLIQTPAPCGWTAEEVGSLVTWFAAVAGPGDASLAADILDRGLHHRPDLEAALAPLVHWLIENGAAELRSKRRAWLAVKLVGTVARTGDRNLLLPAVRYVFANDDWVNIVSMFALPPEAQTLLEAIDTLLADRRHGRFLAVDLLHSYQAEQASYLVERLLQETSEWPEFPNLKLAIHEALMQGRIAGPVAQAGWKVALMKPPLPAVQTAFDVPAAAAEALRALQAAVLGKGSTHGWNQDAQELWAFAIARGVLRFEVADDVLSPATAELLRRSVGYHEREGVTRGVIRALRSYCEAHTSASDLIAAMLRDPHAASGTAIAAINELAVTPPPSRPTSRRRAIFVQSVQDAVNRVLEFDPRHRYSEVAALLHGVRVMTTDALGREDKVVITEGRLCVDERSLCELLDAPLGDADLVAVGVLYVVHEAIHLQQGIGDKDRVAHLRATGAETTLMHVDLGADHVAARIVADAVPEWTLRHLKDIQGRSLAAFPAGVRHTTAAKGRKSLRIVGVRLDYHARVAGLLDADADQYAFAEFGPAGGSIVLLRSGPPWGLLGVASLQKSEANLLYAAVELRADERGRLDDVLIRVVAEAASGR